MADMAVKIAFIGKNDVSDEVNRMRGDMRRFGDTSRSIFKRMRSDALSMRSVMGGVLGARAVTAGIGVIRNQVRTVTDELISFDHAAVKAAGRYGFDRFSDEFKRIGEAARETGATTRFTAGESAKTIDQFAMAGFNLSESMRLVKPAAKLAMAADLEIAQSAEIAATALAKFDEPVSNFGKVGDILAFTANKTKTNLGEMFETIRSGGGIISTVGSDVATFSALSRAMGDMKMVGEQAGTSMKTGFLRALVGGKGGKKAREALGLDKFVKDSKGNFKDLIDIIAFMESKFAKMGQAERAKSMRQIFGLNAIEGMTAIFKAGSGKLEQYRKEARQATGYVEGLSGKMALSYENKIKEIQSALVEAGFKIIEKYGDEIPGALEKVISTIRKIDFKQIHSFMEQGLKLGKQAYETIKAAIPYLKTAAVIWAGFRVTSGIQTAASTFSHMASTVAMLGSRSAVFGNNLRTIDNRVGGLNSRGLGGLNSSLDAANTKALGVINTLGILATTGFAAYTAADELFKARDQKTDLASKRSERLGRDLSFKNIAKISSTEEASAYLSKLKDAEYAARIGGGISRENIADSIGAFFAGDESNMEKQERLVEGYKQQRIAVEKMWHDFAGQDIEGLRGMNYADDSRGFEQTELEKINRAEQSFDLRQKVEVESVIRFEGNVPDGTTAESKVKAPPVSKESMGVN